MLFAVSMRCVGISGLEGLRRLLIVKVCNMDCVRNSGSASSMSYEAIADRVDATSFVKAHVYLYLFDIVRSTHLQIEWGMRIVCMEVWLSLIFGVDLNSCSTARVTDVFMKHYCCELNPMYVHGKWALYNFYIQKNIYGCGAYFCDSVLKPIGCAVQTVVVCCLNSGYKAMVFESLVAICMNGVIFNFCQV